MQKNLIFILYFIFYPIAKRKQVLPAEDSENESCGDIGIGGQFLTPLPRPTSSEDICNEFKEDEGCTAGTVVQADPAKAHHKKLLTKMAQRYCHYFEGKQASVRISFL